MIRPYKTQDKERLLEIFKLNIPKYFGHHEIDEFDKYLVQKGDTYIILEINGEIVGGTGYEIFEGKKSGSINWIFFHPDHSGKGLGSKMVRYCLKRIAENKFVEKFTVRTSQFASDFFQKFGYHLLRIEKEYWAPGLDLYEMEMDKDTYLKHNA